MEPKRRLLRLNPSDLTGGNVSGAARARFGPSPSSPRRPARRSRPPDVPVNADRTRHECRVLRVELVS
ncbi:hypothetical protein Skr01_19310 [Sphaerisporangium krabiense]|nr:hypothetical protein Skr01_19310 [Sphaerisporangium krabiense]